VQAAINSSVFGVNGFMSEAFENPEGLSFGNVVTLLVYFQKRILKM
jgi:hypothetical protein